MDYCRYSAMPVGRFVLDVHGESRDTWPANDALCAALQVINHLQDCGKDYRDAEPRLYSRRMHAGRGRHRAWKTWPSRGLAGAARRHRRAGAQQRRACWRSRAPFAGADPRSPAGAGGRA